MTKKPRCPTCGSKLGSLNDPEMWRTCNSCNRRSPKGFLYCGWCAAPMENTEMRKVLSDAATPPGGWPNLAAEMLEVRFFIDQGNFADAFELLSILKQRYPLHPELAEFSRQTRPLLRPDTQVNRVVDEVLAGSADLSGSMTRRRAPEWKVPEARPDEEDEASGKTRRHAAVRDEDTTPRGRVGTSDAQALVEGDEALDGEALKSEVDQVLSEVVPDRRRRRGKATKRGHAAVGSSGPVVPLIPRDARTSGSYSRSAAKLGRPTPSQPLPQRPDGEEPSPVRARRNTNPQRVPVPKRVPTSPEPRASSAEAPEPAARPRPKRRRKRPTQADPRRDRLAASGEVTVDAPGGRSRTGDTDVAPVPARTGDTDVGPAPEPPSDLMDMADAYAPAGATGDTQVGPPPEAPPAVTGDTAVGPPPSADPEYVPPKGLTMAVDALQDPAPFDHDDDEEDTKGRKKGRKGARKRQAKRKRQAAPASTEQQVERQEKARKRAARFGQGILGK